MLLSDENLELLKSTGQLIKESLPKLSRYDTTKVVEILQMTEQVLGVELAPYVSKYMKSLVDLSIILDNGKEMKVLFVNIADMSCRNLMYQIGSPTGDWPLINLPLFQKFFQVVPKLFEANSLSLEVARDRFSKSNYSGLEYS